MTEAIVVYINKLVFRAQWLIGGKAARLVKIYR